MLLTLLGILKIAGIILAAILGLLILLLLLLLFVPFRYLVRAEKYEEMKATGKVSWLLHFVTLTVRYQGDAMDMKVRVLGIPIKINMNQDEDDNAGQKSRRGKTGKRKQADKKAVKKKPRGIEERLREYGEEKVRTLLPGPDKAESERAETDETEPDYNGRKRLADRIKASIYKISGILKAFFVKCRNIKFTIQKICDKIIDIENLMKDIRAFIRDEKNKEAFRLIKSQLKVLWKHIRPSKLSLSMRYGTGDPAGTGQILGCIGVISPVFHQALYVEPDFENRILEGRGLIKGRIRVFTLLRVFLKLYFNENVKYLIQRYQSIRRK